MWYSAGTSNFNGWEGRHLLMFSRHCLGLGHRGHINVPVTKDRARPYDTWVEMKVSMENGRLKEIRVARVIVVLPGAPPAR